VIYFIQHIINNKVIEESGKNITLDDLCFKPVSGKGCLSPSPMDIWLQDPALLDEDKDLQHTTLCTESIDLARTNIPCSDVNGIPVIREAVFGGT
jgi:Niemann-Pick C1 protein